MAEGSVDTALNEGAQGAIPTLPYPLESEIPRCRSPALPA
jgi:hypothetical protein